MAQILFKRGTKAQLDSAAGSSGLNVGEPYYITDTQTFAVGISSSEYVEFDSMAKPLTYLTASGTNAIASISSPANAPTGQRHVIRDVVFSYSGGAPSGGTLTLGGTTTLTHVVTAQGVGQINPALAGATAGTFTASLAAGGTGVVGRLSIGYSTEAA